MVRHGKISARMVRATREQFPSGIPTVGRNHTIVEKAGGRWMGRTPVRN